MKVSQLSGAALDWAVAKCEGFDALRYETSRVRTLHRRDDAQPRAYAPSTDWTQGGPIIEREKLELRPGLYHSELWACWGQTQHGERNSQQGKIGPTPLIAAMRCYVASKLGDEIEIPKELVQ